MTGLAGNKILNKITIEEFAPKEEELRAMLGMKSKRSKKTKSMKSSHTGEQADDRNLQDAEADEALELRKRENKVDLLTQHKEEQRALKNEIEMLLKEQQQQQQ